MQEGILIASFRCHQPMITIFEDFLDWMISIIDNLLILYYIIVLVVRRYIKHHVYPLLHNRTCGSTMYQAPCLLKSVKFIGFECTKGSFKITDERKQQI